MRILLVHNFYRSASPSGEASVLAAERAMLVARGHHVETFTVDSDSIAASGVRGTIRAALGVPWNPAAAARLRRVVVAMAPDVVHVHNTFPLLSPAVFHGIGDRAARVLTLHNYRLFCCAGIPVRSGKACTACLDSRTVWPALKHRCYRSSLLATMPLAAGIGLHRALGTWTEQVEAFIALSAFQAELMGRSGLPVERLHVKPNFYSGTLTEPIPWSQRADKVVFAGRLAPEKGAETLVRAWLRWGREAPELIALGDGPLRPALERLLARAPEARVRLYGTVAPESVAAELARSKLLILPAEGLEPFGMVVLEAFACATPVVVSDLGSLPALVGNDAGLTFAAGSVDSLLATVRGAWETPGLLERLAQGAKRRLENLYAEPGNYERLKEIYLAAIERRRRRLSQRRASSGRH